MKVVTIINQKGGVGKTTVCRHLSAMLTEAGYRVLCLDMDPQQNLDTYFGVALSPLDTDTPTLYHVLTGACSLKDAIVSTPDGDIVRADNRMYSFSGNPLISIHEARALSEDVRGTYNLVQENLRKQMDPETDDRHVLSRALRSVENEYDWVLLDTNPNLGYLSLLSLLSARVVYTLIPSFCEESSRQSILELYNTIDSIQANDFQQKIKIVGILISRYENNRISKKYAGYLKKMAKDMDTIVFESMIPKSVVVQESMAFRQSIFKRSKKQTISLIEGYHAFFEEFLRRMEEISEDN